MHTGVGWWTLIRVAPSRNEVTITARSPLFPGKDSDPKCGNTYRNGSFTFAPSLCSRFPGLRGCSAL
jgi:hypothetical protein